MPGLLTAISEAMRLGKQILDLANAAKDAKPQLLTSELMVQLAKVNAELARIIEENTQLRDEVRRLRELDSEVPTITDVYIG